MQRAQPGLQLLLLSHGAPERDHVAYAREGGFDACLTKPIHGRQLRDCLRMLLLSIGGATKKETKNEGGVVTRHLLCCHREWEFAEAARAVDRGQPHQSNRFGERCCGR